MVINYVKDENKNSIEQINSKQQNQTTNKNSRDKLGKIIS